MAEEDNNARIAGRLAGRRSPADVLQPENQRTSRNQAGSGTLGAQTGDFSGTGVNIQTSPVRRGNRALDTSPRSNRSSFEALASRANDFLDNLDRQARLGRVSVRSASNIAARVLGDLGQQQASRFNTTTDAVTSDLDRFGRASEGALKRQSDRQNLLERLATESDIARSRIEASRQEGALDRASRESISGLDREVRAALGLEGLDVERARLDETRANNRRTQQRLNEQLGLERERVGLQQRQFDEGVRQFGIQQEAAASSAERESLSDQANFKLETIESIAKLLDTQSISLPNDVRTRLGNILNQVFDEGNQE